MTEEQAKRILEHLEVEAAKTRSILMETNGVEDQNDPHDVGMMVLIDLFPWMFEPKRAFLVPLAHLNQRVRKHGTLDMGEFMNFMQIAHTILPLEAAFPSKWGYELPTPSDVMKMWGKHEPEYDPRKDEDGMATRLRKWLEDNDKIEVFDLKTYLMQDLETAGKDRDEDYDYMRILDEVTEHPVNHLFPSIETTPGDVERAHYEYEMEGKARIITPPLNIPTPAMKIDDISVDLPPEPKHPTQHGHTSIFDFPHLEESVRMLVFVDGKYPLSFMFGGTTIYQADKAVATASPWIDGSMFVHNLASNHVYLVSVVDVLNAVFKLEGIDVTTIKGGYDTTLRTETQSIHAFDPDPVKARDLYGSEIEVGDRVTAMIGITNAMAYGDDADDMMLIRRGWRGIVEEVVSDRAVEVKFDRMTGDTVEILSEYIAVLGEDDED